MEKALGQQESFETGISDAEVLFEFAETDEASAGELADLIEKLDRDVTAAETESLLSGETDANNAICSIQAGAGGAVCAAASLQLAAARPNFMTFECMIFPNPLRDELLVEPVGMMDSLVDGQLAIPDRPGIGAELDMAVVERWMER